MLLMERLWFNERRLFCKIVTSRRRHRTDYEYGLLVVFIINSANGCRTCNFSADDRPSGRPAGDKARLKRLPRGYLKSADFSPATY